VTTISGKRRKAVVGFVVKKETWETDPFKPAIRVKVRVEVSRVYHSRDAAVVCMELFKKQNPNTDYYVHEKNRRDDTEIN
jgi:hypothetical protein